uniref:Medium-chain acyl-CoA ligase ACSF2, mitochondrial n=1 Tax=Piliocolobus tephrosceles TaxID=591936 RepID=A0A8C9LQG6_9PRIM
MEKKNKMEENNNLSSFLELQDVHDRYITDLNTNKKCFSYDELYKEIQNMQTFFRSINIKRNDAISIILFNSIEYVISFLSINFYNGICLPLNTNLKKEEYINYLINNCDYIIVHDYDEEDIKNYSSIKKKHMYYKNVCLYLKEIAEEYNVGLIKIKKNNTKPFFTYSYVSKGLIENMKVTDGTMSCEKVNDEDVLTMTNSKDICLYLHTSGTTSKVKIVQLTNSNIKTTTKNIINTYNINRDDNTIIVMPLYHVHGLIGVLLPTLHAKGNILFQYGHSFSASDFWKNVVKYNITFFSAVPTILKILLLRYNNDYFIKNNNNNKVEKIKHNLRFIRTSSSCLDEHIEKQIEEKFEVSVTQAYGMTEACHQVSSNRICKIDNNNKTGIDKKYKSVGIPNVGVIIYNHDKKEICGYNEMGEICINGANLMYGYKEKKDNNTIYVSINNIQNKKKDYMLCNPYINMLNNNTESLFFKTGDVGYIDTDNFLFITGRIKEIINRGGEKIIPNEIDDVLKRHDYVSDCLTFSIKDEIYGESVNTAVILDEQFISSISSNKEVLMNEVLEGDLLKSAVLKNAVLENGTLINGTDNPQTCEDPNETVPKYEEQFDINQSIELNLLYYEYKEELKKYMRLYLSDLKIPSNIYFVNCFLKTDTGKLSRKKVSEGVLLLKNKEIYIFDIIALILKKYEIKYIYGLYGIPLNKFLFSFIKRNIYYISFRNEINASISCNYVHYFSINKNENCKKKIGILLTCSGPAFINTLSGLYNARINKFPMLLICFENFISDNLCLFEKYYNFQYFPQKQLLQKATELCIKTYHVDLVENFTDTFNTALCTALEQNGPVYINMAYKLLNYYTSLEKAITYLRHTDECLKNGSLSLSLLYKNPEYENCKENIPHTIAQLITQQQSLLKELIHSMYNIYKKNKKGVIFLGINCYNGIKYVKKLSELLELPIYTNTMAKCYIKENYFYNFNLCKTYLFDNIDFCFCIGSEFNFYFNFGNFVNCKKENMVCIDTLTVEETDGLIKQKIGDKQLEQECSSKRYFFSNLYYILKHIYLFFKKKQPNIVDMEMRKKWMLELNMVKKKICKKFLHA